MKNFLKIPVMALAVGMLGCASNGQVHQLESASETNTRLLRENEQRLKNLETSVSSLNSQVAQLNNRVYEVRTRNGKKTSMTVVPIVPPTQAPAVSPATAAAAPTGASSAPAATAAAPVAGSAAAPRATHPNSRAEALLASARRAAAARNQAAQGASASAAAASGTQNAAATPPIGRMIDPAAAPTPIPAPVAVSRTTRTQTERGQAERSAGATGSVGRPEAVAGPSGSLAAQTAPAPAALPPVDLPPAAQAPATSGTQAAPAKTASAATGTAVPVPAIPASSLALPPEHPDLPPVGQPQPVAPTAPAAAPQTAAAQAQAAPAVTPTPRAASPRGEEAAYKAALNATLAGRTTEGIRLFRDFLQQYPDGRYAANAEYWIGECLYSQGKYQDALAQFQGVNATHPRHHKNADALLKAGMTLSRLGDKAGAAEKYRALMTQFPNSDAARRARAMGVAR
ncbi:tol-pal system protein YbgF [uncultured Desulfovibrio sp.]|uniref:tol-pal system protein YbgF n=3 Tax=uncultured Desulfovibrio sp. TaxID=167968 RepID=UPI0025DB5BE5|nr:tol-pal system protein YbgF [uncultured Desulfovibrio sp.]